MGDRENTAPDNHQGQNSPPARTPPAPNPEQPHGEDVHQRAQTDPQPSEHWFVNPDWWMVVLTLLTLIVAVVTLRVFYRQFVEMKTQTGILNTQAQQAASDSIESAKKVDRQLTLAKQQTVAAQDSVKAIQRQVRQQERAWLRADYPGVKAVPSPNAPIAFQLTLVDIGKTSALRIRIHSMVETPKIEDAPVLTFPKPHSLDVTGLLQPNESVHPMVYTTRPVKSGVLDYRVLAKDERDDLINGRRYVVTHIYVTYDDIFRVHHWMKMCWFEALSTMVKTMNAQNCANYAAVDNN